MSSRLSLESTITQQYLCYNDNNNRQTIIGKLYVSHSKLVAPLLSVKWTFHTMSPYKSRSKKSRGFV